MCCRENYGDYFGITVAGYPEAHPEVITDDAEEMEKAYQSDLQYLKSKVAGTNCWPANMRRSTYSVAPLYCFLECP